MKSFGVPATRTQYSRSGLSAKVMLRGCLHRRREHRMSTVSVGSPRRDDHRVDGLARQVEQTQHPLRKRVGDLHLGIVTHAGQFDNLACGSHLAQPVENIAGPKRILQSSQEA